MKEPSIVVLNGHALTSSQPGMVSTPSEPAWGALQVLGQVDVYPSTSAELVEQSIGDVKIVLNNKTPFRPVTLEDGPSIHYIGVMATGLNVFHLEYARVYGIKVKNASGYDAESLTQHVLAVALAFVSRIAEHDASLRQGGWSVPPDFCYTVTPFVELSGKTMGVVGMGAIGQAVSRLAASFGMRVAAAHQRSMADVAVPGVDLNGQPLDALLEQADILTLHCPLTPNTESRINSDRLSRMKSTALQINIGWGHLVDELASRSALEAGDIGGAALDLLRSEPPPAEHRLLRLPNCIVTPYDAWATREARHRLMNIVVNGVIDFLGI